MLPADLLKTTSQLGPLVLSTELTKSSNQDESSGLVQKPLTSQGKARCWMRGSRNRQMYADEINGGNMDDSFNVEDPVVKVEVDTIDINDESDYGDDDDDFNDMTSELFDLDDTGAADRTGEEVVQKIDGTSTNREQSRNRVSEINHFFTNWEGTLLAIWCFFIANKQDRRKQHLHSM